MQLDRRCQYVMGSSAEFLPEYEVTWTVPPNATLATFFPAVYVTCDYGERPDIADVLPVVLVACAWCNRVLSLLLPRWIVRSFCMKWRSVLQMVEAFLLVHLFTPLFTTMMHSRTELTLDVVM